MTDKTILKYNVVMERQITELIEQVTSLVHEGWEPIGGVSQTHDGVFMQAVVYYL